MPEQTAKEALAELTTEITEAETVIDGAVTFINGIPDLIKAAVDAAVANGATAAEVAPVAQLGKDIKAKSDALKEALLANTPPPANP